MAGRVGIPILFLLVFYLQPILQFASFISLVPGRDTQGFFGWDDTQAFIDRVLPFSFPMMHMFLQYFATLMSTFLHQATYLWITTQFLGILVLRQALSPKLRSFTRKHGRWRHQRFFPSVFLLLSSIAVSSTQLAHALQFPPGRVIRLVLNQRLL